LFIKLLNIIYAWLSDICVSLKLLSVGKNDCLNTKKTYNKL